MALSEFARRGATDMRLIDIAAAEFDVEVRLAELVPLDMIAVPLMCDIRMLVASTPDYPARWHTPSEPADLGRHLRIAMRLGHGGICHGELENTGRKFVVNTPPLMVFSVRHDPRSGAGWARPRFSVGVVDWQRASERRTRAGATAGVG
ncbi:hypothetical protein ACVCID_18230 [Burkholderia glumae]